ncbi:DUF2383 domain-containing protein [Hoeflea sp. BAL378]|uniref:DUF2383 domain-containing protein n=1 Tax=Hoeflea sp. BAL378 TaxID=1547437 RepID=UPI000AB7BA3C|nr:DUF2383 domain-containing protein [Hoeflea sp. BAL378]
MTIEDIHDKTAEVLNSIGDTHIALIDAVHGYDVMLEKAEPEIHEVLKTTRQTTARQAAELAKFLMAHGKHPSEDGSFMSAVHEGVVRTRAFFTDIDGDVLPAVADGERRIVSSYDDALETLADNMKSLPRDTFDQAHTLLIKHRAEIEEVVRKVDSRHHVLED